MVKLFERAFPLFFVGVGIYLALTGVTALETARVFIRLSITPLALAFFALTFYAESNRMKVVAVVMFFFGLALAFFGFGSFANGHHGTIVIGLAGIAFIPSSFRVLYIATKN